MRPVRFVALSDDGQALVLADELGRLLALPLDERVQSTIDISQSDTGDPKIMVKDDGNKSSTPRHALNLSPRDIQTRIRSGESADDIATSASVPVDRVLRYAGPVLQERAMLAQSARRAHLNTSGENERMSTVVDAKLAQHGVDPETVSWDAWRLEDGSWMVQAAWSSGKTTAHACWQLDRTRRSVRPDDEMAQFLSSQTPQPRLTTNMTSGPAVGRKDHANADQPTRDPMHGVSRQAGLSGSNGSTVEVPAVDDTEAPARTTREPAAVSSAGLDEPLVGRSASGDGGSSPAPTGDHLHRDRLKEVLERPFEPEMTDSRSSRSGPTGLPGSTTGSEERESPEVPSLALLRPGDHKNERTGGSGDDPLMAASGGRSRSELPAWDDVLFGGK
ncbi:septation protein SepH [Haloglycomyces albus]|uniref:septation protein SepH n=1 Tax=Haloglycomyces albus TaxID=526067 RepID=UPI00046C96ED|nr:septation protein SepH [Haloglycomyces albus]